MPTRDETTRLYRKLVDVLGQHETDTLFTLIWEANGRGVIDFRLAFGTPNATDRPA